jgi:hypothetical protein
MRIITGWVLGALLYWIGIASGADPRSGDLLSNTCAGCHATLGASSGGPMPNIDGIVRPCLEQVPGRVQKR